MAEHDMERVFQLETEVAIMSETEYDTKSDEWVEVPLVKLSQLVPSVPWLHYINKAFNKSGISIKRGETVLIPGEERMVRIGNWTKTISYRDQANLITWRMFAKFSNNFLNMGNDDGQQVEQSIFEKNYGPFSPDTERSENCLAQIKTFFPNAKDDLYIAYHLSSAETEDLSALFASIKDEFGLMV